MSDDPVSRRHLLAIAGAAAALPLVTNASAAEPRAGQAEKPASESATSRLLSPLGGGSKLGAWTVERILPLADGAMSVVLVDGTGTAFQLDICAKDASLAALRGPAVTDKFEIFVANRGDGALGTHEDHGLAAMALADVIRTNEPHVSVDGFRTLAQRIASEKPRVHV